jgi:hypothetical protein
MPVMDRPKDYRGLVRLYSELPEEVRGTLVRVEAWHRLDTTFDQGWDGKCEYCVGVMDGDTGSLPVCEHYRCLSETIFPAQQALWASVGSQWSDLEMCSLDLLHEPDWEELPEGYFAVPDPRSGTDEMTYWRRKDGKRGLSWGAWPTKARYG